MAIQYRVRKLMFEKRQVRTQPVSFLVFQEWFADLLSNVNIDFDVVLYDRYKKRLEEFKRMPFELSTITRLLQMEPYANNNVGYFLERGWTIEEAEQKVTERQSSNSLDAIIKKKKVSKEEALTFLAKEREK